MASKNLKALGQFLTGKSRSGEILYGVLDVLPIPQVHNLFRLAYHKNGLRGKEAIGFVWANLDLTRFAISLAMAIAIMNGWVTTESLQKLIEFYREVQPLIDSVLSTSNG